MKEEAAVSPSGWRGKREQGGKGRDGFSGKVLVTDMTNGPRLTITVMRRSGYRLICRDAPRLTVPCLGYSWVGMHTHIYATYNLHDYKL